MCLQCLWRPEEDTDSLELKLQVLVYVWLLGADHRSQQQVQCKESMRQGVLRHKWGICVVLYQNSGIIVEEGEEGL